MNRRSKIPFVHTREFVKTFPEKPGIYMLVCPTTMAMYIGATNNLRRRMSQHLRAKHSKYLGFNPQILELADTSDPKILDELEQKYISIYKPGLNNPKASKYSAK
jgi:excinuclease UvrABC nuclease subunit